MKTVISLKQWALFTAIACATLFSSCKKEKEENEIVNNVTTTDVASQCVGNFIGSGEDASGNSFVNKVVKVSKVTNTRVRVEAVGHTSITTFEVNIMAMPTGPTSDANESTDFAVRTDTNPHTLAFEHTSGQNFAGFKQ